MKPLMIIGIFVVIAVMVLVFYTVTDDAISIKTRDVDYEASYEITYTDGTTASIKKYATATVKHEGKTVEYITFDLDAKFKVTNDNVRLNTPRNDPDHETRVTFYADIPDGAKHKISEYPLSTFTNADFSVLDTGDWYHVFRDIKITSTELDIASEQNIQQAFTLITEVDVWYNIDPDKNELIHHELKWSIPFKVSPAAVLGPTDGTDVTTGDGVVYDVTDANFVAGTPITSRTLNKAIEVSVTTWNFTRDASGNFDWSDFYNLEEP